VPHMDISCSKLYRGVNADRAVNLRYLSFFVPSDMAQCPRRHECLAVNLWHLTHIQYFGMYPNYIWLGPYFATT